MAENDDKTGAGTTGAAAGDTSKPSPTTRKATGRPRSGADLDAARATAGLPDDAAEEYRALGVNPALDNRLGEQRPLAAAQAVKPQQIPGPEVGRFAEHEEQHGEQYRELFGGGSVGDLAGMKSEGDHGRGEGEL